jgi:UDP-2-acetamido-3-amino-2,3-dideoxy-glucuronate N-acetyltransferase
MERNIAVVGAGYWGKNLVRNFAELGALHTVCDRDTHSLAAISSMEGVATESDYHRVLENPAITGVVLATPAQLHHRMAKEALNAGKDVFVEKPLALTVHDGTELVEMADRAGRVLLVGHLLEYHPAVRALRQMAVNGDLGKIQYIYSNRLNLGKLRTEENVLWSFAPHDIAAILGLLGDELPVEVTAHGGSYLNSHIADVTLSSLTFTSDVRAHIFVSWLHPFKEQRLVVVGDRKMAEFADTDPTDKLKVYEHQVNWKGNVPHPVKGEARAVPFAADEPLRLECLDFLRCIADRGQPVSSGRRALKVLQVLAACQESLECGGVPVRVAAHPDEFFVHQTAIVEALAEIGPGTKIWHFTHVMPDAHIGRGCVLGQNVFVARGVRIGDNVKAENNVSVFEGVTLEDDVFCGPSCVFTNVINPRSHVSRKHEYLPTLIKKGATLGANSVIVCGHTVGRYAFVGAGAVVTHDVPDYALVVGNPARRIGWVCACGVRLNTRANGLSCPECGAGYTQLAPDAIAPAEETRHAGTAD